jgi:nucleotide-binding universal stress UspA family protein
MFERIMLALDGAENGAGPAPYAQALATDSAARVIVVHVTEMMAGRAGGPVYVDSEERIDHVRDQVAALAATGLETELVRVSSFQSPAAAIADLATDLEADVIIIGGSHRGAVLGAILGSTPQALLHIAPCPVLVAPPDVDERIAA